MTAVGAARRNPAERLPRPTPQTLHSLEGAPQVQPPAGKLLIISCNIGFLATRLDVQQGQWRSVTPYPAAYCPSGVQSPFPAALILLAKKLEGSRLLSSDSK